MFSLAATLPTLEAISQFRLIYRNMAEYFFVRLYNNTRGCILKLFMEGSRCFYILYEILYDCKEFLTSFHGKYSGFMNVVLHLSFSGCAS